MLNQNVLSTPRPWNNEAFEQIVKFKPARLILAYNKLYDENIWHYMTFFKFFWKNRKEINCPLYMYVPESSFIWAMDKTETLHEKKLKRFVFPETDSVKFPNWKKYLEAIPMWDFTADEFDFFAFYNFLCKKLAYIEKRMRLFPQLESGMSYGNLLDWLDAGEQDFIFRRSLCRESMLGTDSTRLWKLLEQKSIESVMRNIKWNKLSNGNIFYQLTCADFFVFTKILLQKKYSGRELEMNSVFYSRCHYFWDIMPGRGQWGAIFRSIIFMKS